MSQASLEKIANKLNNSDDIVIIAHVSPDGDTIGSSLALYITLINQGKRVCLLCGQAITKQTNWLPYVSQIQQSAPFSPQVVVAVDCGDRGRVGELISIFDQAPFRIVIDHHPSNDGFGDLNAIDSNAAATGELIYRLILIMKSQITCEIATCLYAALASDTGNFSYANVHAFSFEMAADLVKIGVDVSELTRLMFRQRSKRAMRLLGVAIEKMQYSCDDRICDCFIEIKTIQDTKAENGDFEGLVNFFRDQEGVEVAVFAKETFQNEFKISMRSVGEIDVCRVAQQFDGGGHMRAAACLIKGELQEVREKLLQALSAQFLPI